MNSLIAEYWKNHGIQKKEEVILLQEGQRQFHWEEDIWEEGLQDKEEFRK